MADKEKGWIDRGMEALSEAGAAVVLKGDKLATQAENTVTGSKKVSLTDTLKSWGLTEEEASKFSAHIQRLPNIRSLKNELEKGAQGQPTSEKPSVVGQTIAAKWKQDPKLLDSLNKDLNDPKARDTVLKMVQQQPEKLAQLVTGYDGQNMAKLLNPSTSPATGGSTGSAAPKERTREQANREVKQERAATSSQPKPSPPQEKVQPVTAAAHILTEMSPEDKELFKKTFIEIGKGTDKEISDSVDESFTQGLAAGIADYAVEKFGVEKSVADGFKDRINRDGKLRKAIEDNLKENPDFIRQLATTMKDEKGLPQAAQGVAKSAMTSLMENPEQLAKPDYLKSMTSQMQMAGSATSGFGFLKNMFGMDMNGMMAGVGAWFNKIATWFNNVIQQFTGGNFLAMRNSGMGLFGAFGAAMNQASIDRDMNAMGLPQINYGMIKGKDGQVMHAEPLKDENGKVKMGDDGKPFMKQVPNTVEVTTINGEKHQVIPSAGLTIYRDQQGNFRVPVGTQMERGQITEMTTLVMNQKQFQEYEQKLRDPNGDFAYKGKFDMVYMEPTTVTSVDAKNGAVGAPQAQQAPTPQQQAPRVAQQVAPGMNEPRLEPEKASG